MSSNAASASFTPGRERLVAAAAALVVVLLVGVNVVATHVARGALALAVTVEIAPASLASRVEVFARTQASRDEALERQGTRFVLGSRYVKKLFLVADPTLLPQLEGVSVTLGDEVFRFPGALLAKAWAPDVLQNGREALRAPGEVSAPRSRLGAVRAGVMNWAGDAAFLRLGVRAAAAPMAVSAALLALVLAIHLGLRRGLARRFEPALRSRAWLVPALLVPFVAVWSISAHHEDDVMNLERWGSIWRQGPRSIYVGTNIDYPFLAQLVTALPLSLLSDRPGDEQAHQAYRYLLAVFDAGWFVLLGVLLKSLGTRRAWLWCLAVALLPSSWAGSSVWGQIEGVGQLLICATTLSFVQSLRADRPRTVVAWSAASGLGCGALLVLKQLLVFAVFPLLALAALAWWRAVRRDRRAGALAVLAWAAACAVALFGPDLWLHVPAPFHSHLAKLWLAEGGAHAAVVSINGFNLWLLANPGSNAAFEPAGALVPVIAGPTFFGLYTALLVAILWRHRRLLEGDLLSRDALAWRRPVIHVLFAFALFQLAMALLLVGTADRYLYHFYPFAFAALLAARAWGDAISGAALAGLAACALLYGLFVLGAIAPLPEALVLAKSNTLVSAVHLALFVQLQALWLRQLRADARLAAPPQQRGHP